MKVERVFKKGLQMQRLFHLILFVAIIMIFSFSCGTEKVVVKDETKKIEQAKVKEAKIEEAKEKILTKEGFGWYADITRDNVNVRANPSLKAKVLTQSFKTDVVKVLGKR